MVWLEVLVQLEVWVVEQELEHELVHVLVIVVEVVVGTTQSDNDDSTRKVIVTTPLSFLNSLKFPW